MAEHHLEGSKLSVKTRLYFKFKNVQGKVNIEFLI